MRRWLAARPPGHALDLGGGHGRHAAWLRERGWHVLLLDHDEDAVAAAAARGLAAARQDLTQHPWPVAGPYDVVLVHRVLYQLPASARGAVVERAAGALDRGGELLLVEPSTVLASLRPPGGVREIDASAVHRRWRQGS